MVDAPLTEELAELESRPARHRRPLLGYALVVSAVALWAFNATVSKVVLESGLTSFRLAETRAAGATVLFVGAVLLTRPGALRTSRAELPWLVAFGVFGLAFVQFFYYVGIERLDIGVALVIQYTAPVLVALWARFAVKEPVRRRLWYALALSLAGLSLVVDVWGGFSLDGVGVAACLVAAGSYAVYVLLAERSLGRGRDVLSLLAWGFVVATAFWTIAQPWWSYPFELLDGSVSLLGRLEDVSLPVWTLLVSVVVLGTFVPFILMLSALHHLPATRVVIVAMLEPVIATAIAFAWLGESLSAGQIAGGLIVLAGVGIAQTARVHDGS